LPPPAFGGYPPPAYGPYPPPAYGAHPPPPYFGPMPPPPAGTNGFAVAALVVGIVGGILGSLVGGALGIVALRQIRRTGQQGRGLAIGGLVAAGGWLLVTLAFVVAIVLSGPDDSGSALGAGNRPSGVVSISKLLPGNCIGTLPDGDVDVVKLVPCSQPHEGEVYTIFTIEAGPFPGDAAVQEEAGHRCASAFERYATPATEDYQVQYWYPSRSTWSYDRGVTCVIADPDARMTGSVWTPRPRN